MNLIIDEERSESRAYKRIFEYIKSEGMESFQIFLDKYFELTNANNLMSAAIFDGMHRTIELTSNHGKVVDYFRQCKKDLYNFDLNNPNFIRIISKLIEDMDLLERYLQNAEKLERLRVSKIELNSALDSGIFTTQIVKDQNGIITDITKYYSDGIVVPANIKGNLQCEEIFFKLRRDLENETETPSWALKTENHEDFTQRRSIMMTDFGINLSNLPTEEEICSYEIPKALKLK